MKAPARIILMLFCAAAFQACAVVEFPDKSTIALDSLASKTWRSAVFLEQDIYNPGTYAATAGSRTFNGFALSASGGQAYVALSLYDPSSSKFEGYVRTYSEGTGWLTGAAGFQRVATSATAFGFGAPWVTTTADGRATAGFWAATDAAGTSLAVTRRGNRWGRAQLSTVTDSGLACQVGWGVTTGSVFDLALAADQGAHHGFGTGSAPFLSSDGRLYLFYANASTDELKLEVIDPASQVDDAGIDYSNLSSTLTAGTTELRHVEGIADGTGLLCYFHEGDETGTRQVVSRCLDLTVGGVSISPDPPALPNAVSTSLSKGFSAASDAAGTILSVQYENTASDGYEPTYSVFKEAAWDSLSGLIDSASSNLKTPADIGLYPEAYPVVAHIETTYWAAAWVRIDDTTAVETLYAALYDAELDEWSEAVALVELTYAVHSRIESLTLVGNHTGDLVLAARYISVENTSGNTEDDKRRTMAWRYNSSLGWLSGQVLGQGCLPSAASRIGECTQPVQAVILPSGNALIVFPDQDPSGITRPAASEFK